MIDLNLKFKINSKIFIKYFLTLSYVVCILSISTGYDDLLIFKYERISLVNVINFIRQFSVILIFFFISYQILYLVIKRKINFQNNVIYIYSALYFFSQIFGLIYTDNSIENITLIISSVTFIGIIMLVDYYYKNMNEKILFLILSFIFVISFFKSFYPFITGERSFYGAIYSDTLIFLNKDAPRSSGTARTLVILLILSQIIFFNFLKKNKFISVIFKIFTVVIVLNLQSRAVIIMTLITFFSFYLVERNYSFKNILKYFSYYLIIPLILIFIINFIHSINYYDRYNDKVKNYSIKENIITNNTIRGFDGTLSSGRVNDWNKIYQKFLSINLVNKLYGFGSQGDRYSINQTASNGFIYALISSGIIGLIFYVLFSIIIFLKSIKFFFEKPFNDQNILFSTLVIIIFFRSIVETSYALFGVDFIVFFSIVLFINKTKKVTWKK